MGKDFVLLAGGTSFYVVGNPFFHPRPPVLLLCFPNGFVAAWMSCCGVVVHEGHNASFDLNDGWYDDFPFGGSHGSGRYYEFALGEYCDVFIVGFPFIGTRWS